MSENKPYHNKGFGLAFFWIIVLTFGIPLGSMMFIDDTFARMIKKYGDPIRTECWENSKHERTCNQNNSCKFGRNFCIEGVFRWKE